MGSQFHVTVPQGLGDIFWCYQKLMPLCNSIKFNVVEYSGQPKHIVRRAEPMLRALPGVVDVNYVAPPEDNSWLSEYVPLTTKLRDLVDGNCVAWSANAWLEKGVPIERIDPNLPVLHSPALTIKRPLGIPDTPFIAMYVSGDTVRHRTLCERVWSPEQWLYCIDHICYNNSLGTRLPIVLLGAQFDYSATAALHDLLTRKNYNTLMAIDFPLEEVLWLLANAWGFLSYQSGLGILADAVGARQMFVYFPRIIKMADSWVNPIHRGDGRFQFDHFESMPKQVASRVDWSKPPLYSGPARKEVK